MRLVIATGTGRHAAVIRAMPLAHFGPIAAAINDSPPLMRVYAAPAWDELGDSGREWVMALVRECLAMGMERSL